MSASEHRGEAGARADDRFWMRRALALGRRGDPSPNPRVGAVVVRAGEKVAEGFHQAAGQPHAEALALKRAGDAARGATLYVTLEPCNHFGRTPPCTAAILAAGIKRVVVGTRDPAPHAPGALEALERAGIAVETGVLEGSCFELLRGFPWRMLLGRPRVTLKAATSLDGCMATANGASKWLTGPRARREAHALRAAADALVTGAGTLRCDDPELSVRAARGRHPQLVIVAGNTPLPKSAKAWQPLQRRRPSILLLPSSTQAPDDAADFKVWPATAAPSAARLQHLLARLANEEGINDVLVEAGPKLTAAFFEAGLVDRLCLFVAPVLLGAADGQHFFALPSPRALNEAPRLVSTRTIRLGPDLLIEGFLPGALAAVGRPEALDTAAV